jgi:hypothetical protein
MRITESRMRQIIREEAKRALQEMPYAGSLGIRQGSDDFELKDEDGEDFSAGAPRNIPGAAKYARSSRFKNQATKLYANFPHNVWLASWAGDPREIRTIASELDIGLGGEYAGERRVVGVELVPDGIRILEEIGFEAPSRVGPDDLVIIHSISDVDRANLSSPWMIFHSMFDDQAAAPDNFIPSWYDLDLEGMVMGLKYSDGTPLDDDTSRLGLILTMGSAREGRISAVTDIPGEAICQELLTKGGFRYKTEALDDEGIEAMEEFAAAVRVAADEFRQGTKGMLLAVATS